MKVKLLGNLTTTVKGKREILLAGSIVELDDKEAKSLIAMKSATTKLAEEKEEELDQDEEEKEERRKKK